MGILAITYVDDFDEVTPLGLRKIGRQSPIRRR